MTGLPANVSRETQKRLAAYAAEVRRWNPAINLVSKASLADLEQRHIADSLQLWPLAPETAATWIDLGSGGGFPGLVIAAIAAEERPALRMTLVESDTRKAAFLATAARAMGVTVTVIAGRIEAQPPLPHDVVSARALAPLDRLLPLARRFTGPGSVMLFPKGARVDSELTGLGGEWHGRLERIPSQTDPSGAILRLREIEAG